MTSTSVDYSHDKVGVLSHDGLWRYLPMESRLNDIRIENESLGHALTDKSLWVPANQRNYAWKEKHVNDLYSDLKLAITTGAHEYFLGSVVVIADTKNGRSMVVDGQQRLATTLILLSAIRDFFDDNNDERGARILEGKYILSPDFDSREDKPHLHLNEIDHEYFLKRVLLPKSDPRRQETIKLKNLKPSHANINKAVIVAAVIIKR